LISAIKWFGGKMYYTLFTDKKENQIFLIYKNFQNGAVAND
jgi:hypothetical protein